MAKKQKEVVEVVKTERVQSGKFWHEGESWYCIYGKGNDGEEAQQTRIGPFKDCKEALDALVQAV